MSEHSPDRVDPETVRRGLDVSHDRSRARRARSSRCLRPRRGHDRGAGLARAPRPPVASARGLGGGASTREGKRLFSGAWSTTRRSSTSLARARLRHRRATRTAWRSTSDGAAAGARPGRRATRCVRYEDGDERTFYEVHQETSRTPGSRSARRTRSGRTGSSKGPDFVPELWFLALAGDEPAGFAICHPHSRGPELGWVRILGVRRPWRRRGSGRALLLHAFARVPERGLTHAGLGVDCDEPDRCEHALRERGHARRPRGSTSTRRRSRELAARALPRLPHADRGRDRARVPVPQLRTRVRGGARARAARVGHGRRGDGRGGRARASVPGDGGRRRGHARRADARRSRRRCRSVRSSSAAAAARTSVRSGACAARRPARGRLARRARRPEHARDVAVREPVGDAAADAPRRRRGARRRTSLSSARATSIPARLEFIAETGIDDSLDRALDGVDARLRRARRRRARPVRGRRLHARAGRSRRVARGRGGRSRDVARRCRSRDRRHGPRRRRARTSPSSRGCSRPPGL